MNPWSLKSSLERGSHIKAITDLHTFHDFPQKGVNFLDVFPVIQHFGIKPPLFAKFKEKFIFVPEARGFIFYSLFPHKFIPLRKLGKIPSPCHTYNSTKEYGSDVLQFSLFHLNDLVHLHYLFELPDSIEVAFFDDVLATGNTALSFATTINNFKFKGISFICRSIYSYIELSDLKGRELLENHGLKVKSFYTI